ncbi:Histidine kinase-, DNA gyrase B-, and HSP90-like ATPase [Paenimyroides ummariense]|uniref:histidine kinase n=1 Tax=Paenimyroides ummariense TaxID=913024 RepID=A0A1I4XX58_9FLAO|nr:ATP-binding protein [Paenimyroides ummariense]SFN29819.1 Histidine kinase-, DNA gyrase B-, and HSP90-like ATPase [Paenimyroides ummariense]
MRKLVVLTLFSLFFAVSCKKPANVYDHILIHKKVTDSNYKTFTLDELYYCLLYNIQFAEQPDKAKNQIAYYENQSLSKSDSIDIYRANNLQIFLNSDLNSIETRNQRLFKSATYFENQNNLYDAYLSNYLIAQYYFNTQNFQLAENHAYKAIENLGTKNKEYAFEKASTFVLISNIHYNQKKYTAAFNVLKNYDVLSDYFNKKLIVQQKINSLQSTYINNYAVIGNKIGKISLKQTIADLKTAYNLASFSKKPDNRQKITALHNLIHYKIEAKDLDSLDNYVDQFRQSKPSAARIPIMQVNFATIGDYLLKIKKDTIAAKHFQKELLLENEQKFKNLYLEKRILEQIMQNTDSTSVELNNHYLNVISKIQKENDNKLNINQKVIYENHELVRKNEKLKREIFYIVAIILSVSIISLLVIYSIIQKINLKKIQLRNNYIEQDTKALEVTLTYKNNIENKLNNNKKQIFMELHDNIVNKLFSTRFLLHKDFIKPESLQIAKNTVLEVKSSLLEICDNYNEINNLFEKDSFHHMIIELIENQPNNIIEFDYDLDLSIEWFKTHPKVRFHLYRILQELLQNIHKHSSATKATVEIYQENSNITLIVFDNGKGFKKTAKKGLGINNIQNRLKEINGNLTIDSTKGTQFTITVNL